MTPATIGMWKRKASGEGVSNGRLAPGVVKERRAVQEFMTILSEMETIEAKLVSLKKRYQEVKSKL